MANETVAKTINKKPTQKEMEIDDNLKSIRLHLDTIKKRQDSDDIARIERDRKIDLIVNSLTDTDYNGKNGYISRLNNIETMVINHDLYWKLLFTIIIAGGLLTAAIKIIFK